MLVGVGKGMLAAWIAIVLIGAALARYGFGPGPNLNFSGLFALLSFSAIFVGLPALLGMVAIQMPVARMTAAKGLSPSKQYLAIAGANTLFTLAMGFLASNGEIGRSVWAISFLVIAAFMAAAVWFFFDRRFTRVVSWR